MTLTNIDTPGTTVYKSAQFHFHMPSEHHLNDMSFEAEIHVVHISAAQQYAVYGIVI